MLASFSAVMYGAFFFLGLPAPDRVLPLSLAALALLALRFLLVAGACLVLTVRLLAIRSSLSDLHREIEVFDRFFLVLLTTALVDDV